MIVRDTAIGRRLSEGEAIGEARAGMRSYAYMGCLDSTRAMMGGVALDGHMDGYVMQVAMWVE